MRNTIFALIGALALVGCNPNSDDGAPDEPQIAPEFPEGSGQQANNTKPYPAGPFGIGQGSIVANYKFIGFVNSVAGRNLAEIQMAEFYNPTGDGVFEEGSVFPVGSPKPKGLVIAVGAVWCGPCNYEAENVLPVLYEKYKPQGGEFLGQLADGQTPGLAATSKNLSGWANKYDPTYPLTYDPAYKLGALFEADAFPANMIIDTRTMKIVEVISGVAEEGSAFWKTFDKVLAGTI